MLISYTFKDKVVLVTGGNSGIGLACVEKFLTLGATVIATEGMTEQLGAAFPIGRIGKPAEIANTIAWLASMAKSRF